mgnify:CR=1 FL=1|jgi:hypothetical protein|tara:strand:+ start:17400 stop:18053 length:654 start_codon:yes stop_codon:yes gene_type:complete
MEEKDVLDEAFNLIELIDSIKWPVVVIIAILLLIKPIKNLINRVTKVGYGNKSIEANQQTATKKIEEKEISEIDRVIGLFRPETIEMFVNAIEKETKIEKLKNDNEKIERLKNYSTIIYIMRHFDSIYSAIFGSQIRILERLNTLQPESRDSLKFYYESAKKHNPKFYENYPYEDYLNFLINFMLIREDNGIIQLTILGVDFLKYLTESNKDVNKLY